MECVHRSETIGCFLKRCTCAIDKQEEKGYNISEEEAGLIRHLEQVVTDSGYTLTKKEQELLDKLTKT